MTDSVSSVYIHVVDDVISKVRDEFLSDGVGEHVLSELQALWETKMMQCGVICGNIERPPPSKATDLINPIHDLNVPYEGPTEEYQTPTAEMLFPPTPLQTPLQTPLPGTVEHQMYNVSTPNDLAPITDARDGPEMKQAPSPWMNQRPLGVDVNVANVEGRDEADRGVSYQPMTQDFFATSFGKRKREDYASLLTPGKGYIPQQDGSRDVTIEIFLSEGSQIQHSSIRVGQETAKSETSIQDVRAAPGVPQLDGIHDHDDAFNLQGVNTQDYNTPSEHVELQAATPSVGTPKPAKIEAVDDEPPLNEDDDNDDDLDDLDQEEEEPRTQDLVLAQFDKVTRTKSRWRCTLKDGIMHLNGRDILFNKATGEFDF